MIDLIYCASGNRRFAEIAVRHGWRYGAQLPGTVYTDVAPLTFADQDWKAPRMDAYVEAVARHRPSMATAIDWTSDVAWDTVAGWLDCLAPHVETLIVIPKIMGSVPDIPHEWQGKPIRLGFSVPTKYGGTELPTWEFGSRPVHLLGGSPHAQMHHAHYLNVKSADGNYVQKMATMGAMFWVNGTAGRYATNRWFPTLKEYHGGNSVETDAPHEAFERSCRNVMEAWHDI